MTSQRPYTVGSTVTSSLNSDTTLNVYVSDKHFQIELLADNFKDSPTLLNEYIRHVRYMNLDYSSESMPEFEEGRDGEDDLLDWALEPFLSIFREIPPLDASQKYTYRDRLSAETLRYGLRASGDKLSPFSLDKRETFPPGIIFDPSEPADYSMFPIYRPDEIQISLDDQSNTLPSVPGKVFIDDQQVAFFKLAHSTKTFLRELAAYAKIKSAGFDETVRTPRLYGVVEDELTGRVLGLLLSYIECNEKTLYARVGNTSLQEKWFDQMKHTLTSLHEKQIVWGDGAPVNVLIDTHDNAYLINFGGGYTEGWVDKELANTSEGDLQALERLDHFMRNFSQFFDDLPKVTRWYKLE